MAQQVKIAGALFENVPSISVPDANDVWHAFTDTSDANAAAADIANGKTAYAGGVKLVGTNPGGATVEPLSVTANGTYTAPTGTAYSPVTVNVEGGGGGGGDMSDPIRFFDYDGALVASYSAVPSELPDVPTHEGLVDGTWNYTLAEVGEQFAAVGRCDVGANFSTESGATEIDVEFVDAARLSPYLRFAPNGTVTVDWGDNSPTDTVTGTSMTTRKDVQHVYAAPGKRTIKLTPASGTTYAMYGASAYPLMHNGSSKTIYNYIYANCVKAVRLGVDAIIGNYAFAYCNSIASVTIPSDMTSIGTYAFYNCYSINFVTIPRGLTSINQNMLAYCYSITATTMPSSVTSIGSGAFNTCYSLASIAIPSSVTSIGGDALKNCSSLESTTMPSSVTSIGSNAFSNCNTLASIVIPSSMTSISQYAFSACYSLASIVIPDSVTSIQNFTFYNCYGLAEVHLKRTTPPTLASTNAFSSIATDCKFYVPYSEDHSILAAYQAATNWSTYASRMVEEPQS